MVNFQQQQQVNMENIKKGDKLVVCRYENEKNHSIFDRTTVTVKQILKSGKIKVVSDIGYGFTITKEFFGKHGHVEVMN
jgi:hypothetical protein